MIFAKIEDGTVVNVVVAEQDWIDAQEGTWVQGWNEANTPEQRYNAPIKGGKYDATADAFYVDLGFPSWTLNTSTYQYEPPTPMPQDGSIYRWDEYNLEWVLVLAAPPKPE